MSTQSTVLIVDDERRNRALLEAILKPLGYNIVLAEDGQEALEKTLELRPDLILLDVMMPDITGYEVCETIREDPDLAEIPVLLVTALDDRESRLRGIEAGADDFLSKPVDTVEIQARVKTVTRLNRYRRLVAEREKFSKISDFASDALLLLDRDSRIHHANARARQLLGLQDDGTNRSFIDVATNGFQLQPVAAWERWWRDGPPEDQLLRYLLARKPDGAVVWWQVQVFRLPATGGADWLVRLQDVTGLIGQQREQWSFQRMLSHKMRTPLNGLIGMLDSLTDEDVVRGDEGVAATLRDASESARRLESQVKDVLLYLDAPKLSKVGRPLPVAVLGARLKEIAQRLGLLEPKVIISAASERASIALGATAMDVIFAELFENSLKFHPRMSPRITVAVDTAGEGMLNVLITDDGDPLSAEVLERAMVPYYQGEALVTGEVAGMGLGLAMISQMLWEVGGAVALKNGSQGGVQVSLRLPEQKASGAAA